MKPETKALLLNIGGIVVGAFIAAFGYRLFLLPFKSAPGGVTSLSQILFYTAGITPGIAMLIFNIPLFIIGTASFGKEFGIRTIVAILSMSFFTELFSYKTLSSLVFLQKYLYKVNEQTYSFTSETFLGVVAGGLLLGIGIGIILKNRGSICSTDIPALLLKKYFGLSIGTGYLIIDTSIILLSGIVLKNMNLVLWGIIALYVTSKATDFIMEGYPANKGTYVMSAESAVLREFIIRDLKRGVTVFKGKGGFSEQDMDVLYTVVNVQELTKLKEKVRSVDGKAFLIITDVHEVMGKGFKMIS